MQLHLRFDMPSILDSVKYRWGPPTSQEVHKCGDNNAGGKRKADCDPKSKRPCCSKLGFCGSTNRHCRKDEYEENYDFRTHSKCNISCCFILKYVGWSLWWCINRSLNPSNQSNTYYINKSSIGALKLILIKVIKMFIIVWVNHTLMQSSGFKTRNFKNSKMYPLDMFIRYAIQSWGL